MTCGIYIMSFKGTDKVYIGKSKSIETRANSHMFLFRKNRAPYKLQQAYNTFGNPDLEILEKCS